MLCSANFCYAPFAPDWGTWTVWIGHCSCHSFRCWKLSPKYTCQVSGVVWFVMRCCVCLCLWISYSKKCHGLLESVHCMFIAVFCQDGYCLRTQDSRSPVGRVGPSCIRIVFESIDQRGQQYCRRTFQPYKVHDIGAEVDYRSLPEINIILEVAGPCHVRDWSTWKATEVTEAYWSILKRIVGGGVYTRIDGPKAGFQF